MLLFVHFGVNSFKQLFLYLSNAAFHPASGGFSVAAPVEIIGEDVNVEIGTGAQA